MVGGIDNGILTEDMGIDCNFKIDLLGSTYGIQAFNSRGQQVTFGAAPQCIPVVEFSEPLPFSGDPWTNDLASARDLLSKLQAIRTAGSWSVERLDTIGQTSIPFFGGRERVLLIPIVSDISGETITIDVEGSATGDAGSWVSFTSGVGEDYTTNGPQQSVSVGGRYQYLRLVYVAATGPGPRVAAQVSYV